MMNDELRDMVSHGARPTSCELHPQPRRHRACAKPGLKALYSGMTTIDEVVRETILEDEGF